MQRGQSSRVIAATALVLSAAAVGVVLLTLSSTYVLHAQFYDAGQLVRGDVVTVGGHQVGAVGKLSLAGNGLADVELDISDARIAPLRAATRAHIGQTSLTGVANRFVGLDPGDSGPTIPSDGVLPVTQTRGIVDLDTLLNALTPPVRTSLQRILKTGAHLVAQPTASGFNAAVHYLNPALSQVTQLGGELLADRFALGRLVSSTDVVAGALAARSQDLGGAIASTAAVLREVASQRAALMDTLRRAPSVLGQGRTVLAHLGSALGVLDPTLSDLQPVAPRLATLLHAAVPAARDAIPTVRGVEALVGPARRALLDLPRVERRATPAVLALTRAVRPLTPILAGLRPYAPAVVTGFFGGVGGYSGGYYDANGQFLRTALELGPESLSGILGLLGGNLGAGDPSGSVGGARSGLLAPCPGGASSPAFDRSSPWNSPQALPSSGHICDPASNH